MLQFDNHDEVVTPKFARGDDNTATTTAATASSSQPPVRTVPVTPKSKQPNKVPNKAEKQATAEAQLWKSADILRGRMNPSDYGKFVLPLLGYYYVSQKYLLEMEKEEPGTPLSEIEAREDWAEHEEDYREGVGWIILSKFLFSELHALALRSDPGTLERTRSALNSFGEHISERGQSDLSGVFDMPLDSPQLGDTAEVRNETLSALIRIIGASSIDLDDDTDAMGNAFEYLLKQFSAAKEGGEFFTPPSASRLLSSIVAHENSEARHIYDMTCGTGSLLIQSIEHSKARGHSEGWVTVYGQEKNSDTQKIARLNMMVRGLDFDSYEIALGDTLTHDAFAGKEFDGIVANPPFSATWASHKATHDPRFQGPGALAPDSKADYAFVLNALHKLSDEGVAAIVLSEGVLFRGNKEGKIREWLIKSNYVHAVISLPKDIFYGTSIPTCVLVLKKNRKHDAPVLFVDASDAFVRVKKNEMTDEHIAAIMDAYTRAEEITVGEVRSHPALVEEIAGNGYGLNVPLYVASGKIAEAIDLAKVEADLAANEAEIVAIRASIADMMETLEVVSRD